MGSEKALWSTVRRNCPDGILLQRHEDVASEGIPDVSFVASGRSGWVELKHRHEWPKRATTVVSLDHFTNDQRRWLCDRGEMGACCSVLLQVESDYFVFSWESIPRVGFLVMDEFEAWSAYCSWGRPNWPDLWDAILNC